MTKAVDITRDTKLAVYLRDNGCCVFCGSNQGIPNAHFIPRSHGGLGVERNILTLCTECHHKFDNTAERKRMAEFFRSYLESKYPDWDQEKLYYKKWRFEQ